MLTIEMRVWEGIRQELILYWWKSISHLSSDVHLIKPMVYSNMSCMLNIQSIFNIHFQFVSDVVTWRRYWNLMNISKEISPFSKLPHKKLEEYHLKNLRLIISCRIGVNLLFVEYVFLPFFTTHVNYKFFSLFHDL